MDIFGILSLTGGLALFLYGMNIMGGSLEKISGGRLERLLERLTSQTILAVLLGAAVTAVIQSSSATTVMAVGFVNSGIMKLSQAIGIIMGANVGTTITSWILSLTGLQSDTIWIRLLKPSSFTPVLALIGIVLYLPARNGKKRDVGEILLGFAILMFGMESMSSAVKPLADIPEFASLLTVFQNPLAGILAGTVLTAILQSSSASVGILQALSITGAFTYGSILPIILGQNIGTCVTAMLSAAGATKSAKRTAFVHFYFNLIGAAAFLLLYYLLDTFAGTGLSSVPAGVTDIALIHSIFNITTTLLLLPFIGLLEKLVYLTIPVSEEEKRMEQKTEFAVLDDRFLQTPGFAVEQCRNLVKQMAELSEESFLKASALLEAYTKEAAKEVIQLEQKTDLYEDKIRAYLTRLNSRNLAYQDSQNVSALLHCVTDVERISDHARNVAELAGEMNRRSLLFSKKAKEDMQIYACAIKDILDRTVHALVFGDEARAMTVEPLEEVIDELNKEVKKRHIKRLRKGKCTIELGLILSDVAANYERIADHCSNIAICMLQEQEMQLEAHSYKSYLKESEEIFYETQVKELKGKYMLNS